MSDEPKCVHGMYQGLSWSPVMAAGKLVGFQQAGRCVMCGYCGIVDSISLRMPLAVKEKGTDILDSSQ